ncbi:MAG: hypothetical protein P8Z71_11370 [Candidatus Sulfobium sp.]|jgi:hypothetical protein
MQSEHMPPWEDEKGAEQMLHAGPEYLPIADQHFVQKGAYRRLSVRAWQEGHSEGKRMPAMLLIRPVA